MSEYQRAVWASYYSVTYGAPLPNLALSWLSTLQEERGQQLSGYSWGWVSADN
jgi:hypothetical protein